MKCLEGSYLRDGPYFAQINTHFYNEKIVVEVAMTYGTSFDLALPSHLTHILRL